MSVEVLRCIVPPAMYFFYEMIGSYYYATRVRQRASLTRVLNLFLKH